MSLKKLGRYDLVCVLGKGAMGLVYEGRDPNLERRVAIKTIKVDNLSEEDAAEYEVRFRTEARSAARLQHPNIVSVYDSDRDIDIAYLVMEFIQGDDLKHHMDHGARYTLAQTVGIMTDLLSALDYAHRQNIVHRDIKPANLLIEANGRVKLTDFGVARIQETGEATRTQGSMVGTLKYMSPEQVQGRPIDGRADLFAAGVVLYQLLTGTRPFNGNSDFDIIQNIVGQAPAAPSSLSPGLPPAVDAVVARALEKSREARFPTAQEFSLALQEATRDIGDPQVRPPAQFSSGGAGSSGGTWSETVLQRDLSIPPSIPPSIVTQEVELVYWKDIKDSDDPQDVLGFLAKFPTGIYADLARRRLKRLNWVQDEEATLVTHPAPVPPAATDPTQPIAPPTALAPQAVEKPRPPSPPKPSSKAASRSRRGTRPAVWVLAALLAVAGIGAGTYWGSGTEDAPVAQELAVEPPPHPPQAVEAPAPLEPAPAVVVEAAPAPAVTPSAPVTAPVVDKAVKKPQASKPVVAVVPVEAQPKPSVLTNGPTNVTPKAPASSTEPASTPAASKSVGPAAACEDRWLLAFQACMNTQCARPEFLRHPVCVERRAMDQRRRDAEQLRENSR